MAEHVILFAGPMGAGKSTAIESLSDIAVVSTEAANSDRGVVDKATTTVALDYGEIVVDDTDKVRLYGIPGQRRFDFMWSILMERAKALFLLVNNDANDPIGVMSEFLVEFGELCSRAPVVVGVSRGDIGTPPNLTEYADAVTQMHPGMLIPIFTVDPRDRDQMLTVLMTLIANIESRSMFEQAGVSE